MENNTDKTTIDISKRTKGKWQNNGKYFSIGYMQLGMCNDTDHSDEAEANAAFIVTACNNYDKLVEVLKRYVETDFEKLGNTSFSKRWNDRFTTAKQLLQSIEQDI